MNKIVVYQTQSGSLELKGDHTHQTIWANRMQMAEIFDVNPQAISKHIHNVYKDNELEKTATSSKMELVQMEAGREVRRSVDYYNLEMIISVGYRVNTVKGTKFRQWATQTLKQHIIEGITINQKRLHELGKMVQMIEQSGKIENLQLQEAKGLLDILSHYTKSFVLLNQYDSHNLQNGKLNENITYEIQYNEAKDAIAELKKQLVAKKEATDLFGREKDNGFKSSLQSIVQTFGGQYLYPSIEEQAAHLLYFVIKNHSFNDGNKRIGAFLFIWFLEKNRHRFKQSGELKINDNALTAIALLVAQSAPEEKELMIQLVCHLIKDN
ncbi:MAG: virulence protein RhuM/Fic/DOC family protein [Bacteroidia bacterium]|nr:virulence protein RhuM/Fic/DOC family protein [Bacteroidia bacterium]MBP7261637.1 virulence protein RhuM/Fic/DOC family protein [Bacteroidia bacterium]MBP9181037.1 virulence protein RhuM/Fic/DOC family protein [Bacteroidia bacterium]MBP9724761.1 virulence protein RhuM/Fic/DOC family protein [Bacteroidia bacterium]